MRHHPAILGLLLLVCLGGCAHPDTGALHSSAAAAHPASVKHGIILSMRTIRRAEIDVPLQVALLGDAGGTTMPDGTAGRTVVEFIVRQSDGAIISVVQSNELGFHQGDHVSILRDDGVRLARSG